MMLESLSFTDLPRIAAKLGRAARGWLGTWP
jgi:hypothetical protein